ncbi:IS21 family transposase [Ruegeria sp.]|uniref:IS21 family transposase n=1 Tax=Ruegeria sp. TaxID=1879320 RepID=UPI003B006AD5
MICVETIRKVRRLHLIEKKSIKEICRSLNLSRATVRKIIRSGVTEFKYERKSQPYPVLGPWRARLDETLEENEALPKKHRKRMTKIWKELSDDGFGGGYDSVRRYTKNWRIAHGRQQAQAFIPLIFDPGEAYQFDWSVETVLMDGALTTVKVAHFKLCHSRMPFSIAYPRETQEMVFDAHDEAFKFFGGGCINGIYDNMTTAVDAILSGKERKFNKAFSRMCSHHLVNPIACTRAAGWEKGQVENLVKESCAYSFTPRLEVADFDELNARLQKDAIKRAKELRHPENLEVTVWEEFQQEKPLLTHLQKPFVGFREKTVAVSRTCLINFERNKYSVEARAVGRQVQLQVYATRIVLRQDGEIVGEHERCFGRGKTIFNPWHYVPVLKRKPGALRNGAPFRDWDLPPAMTQIWTHLRGTSDGDRQLADILFAAYQHDIDVVEAACEEALKSGLRKADAILNIVSRRTNPPPPKAIEPPAHLQLKMAPIADCARYDRLGGSHATA